MIDKKQGLILFIIILGASISGIVVARYFVTYIDRRTQLDYVILETYEITPTQNYSMPNLFTIAVERNQLHLFTYLGDRTLSMRHAQIIQPIAPINLYYIIIDRRQDYCKIGLLWDIRGEQNEWMAAIARAGFGQRGDQFTWAEIIPLPEEGG